MYLCTLSGEGIHRTTAAQAEAASSRWGAHLAQQGTPMCPGHSATMADVLTFHTRMCLSAQPAAHPTRAHTHSKHRSAHRQAALLPAAANGGSEISVRAGHDELLSCLSTTTPMPRPGKQ